MSLESLEERLNDASKRILQLEAALSPSDLKRRIVALEEEVGNPRLWDDTERARSLTTELARQKSRLLLISNLQNQIQELVVILRISRDARDDDYETEVEFELGRVLEDLERCELETLLAGEYDSRGAVVTIRSGAGGDDATDFAEMLMRMYLRYSEKQGMKAQVLDISHAEGAGIKSATFEIDAPYAFGNLSVESGTHRLVRMSPFNAAGKRQTSFAAVEVVPLVAQTDAVDVADADIRIDVFRSSGPGGQSVNTTDSAVRITHIPTGIVVSCQNEKSQLQNKAAAMRVLQSRLLELKRQEEDAKKKQLAGDVKASWGEQMRSYVLAPYQMVKDLRTGFEVNNPSDVFDGDLDGFISAGIRWRKQQESPSE